MFLFDKKNVEFDEFGWWLTGCNPANTGIEVLSCDKIVENNLTQSNHIADVFVDRGVSESKEIEDFNSKTINDDPEEIHEGVEPLCKSCSRSYTPERLIRTQDYSILTRSPTYLTTWTPETEPSTPLSSTPHKRNMKKRQRCLNNLIDKKSTGASQLEEILDPEALDVKISGCLNKGMTINEDCSIPKDNLSDFLNRSCDSPRRILTPDLMSSGSSSCGRVDNYEEYHSSMRNEFTEIKNSFEINDHSNELDDIEDNDELLFARNNFTREFHHSNEIIPEEDPKMVVQNLKGRIERIKDTNKDIFGDISRLRNKFQLEEKKTGNLTTETTRLRREIRDLRYLDDLVNLLRGELQRISQRNWPFNIGHSDRNTEEINLVV